MSITTAKGKLGEMEVIDNVTFNFINLRIPVNKFDLIRKSTMYLALSVKMILMKSKNVSTRFLQKLSKMINMKVALRFLLLIPTNANSVLCGLVALICARTRKQGRW